MPEINIGDLLKVNLIAKKQLKAFDRTFDPKKVILTFQAGSSVGQPYSYLERADGIYLMFPRYGGASYYYIKYEPDAFKFTSDIKVIAEKQKQETEKQLIEQKGAFSYYFEKYGKVILLSVVGIIVLKEIIKRK
jgi:hypothetical protein